MFVSGLPEQIIQKKKKEKVRKDTWKTKYCSSFSREMSIINLQPLKIF